MFLQLFIKRIYTLSMRIQVVQLFAGIDQLVKLTGNEVSSVEIFLTRHRLMIEKNNIIWNSY